MEWFTWPELEYLADIIMDERRKSNDKTGSGRSGGGKTMSLDEAAARGLTHK